VAEKVLDFELCAIDLVEDGYLVTKALSTGVNPEETSTLEVGEGIAGKTVEKAETIWGEDLQQHPEAKPSSEDFRAFISTPIGKMGTLQVASTEKGSFDLRDVEMAEILAGHLREELKRVKLEKELRRQAIKDPLTGLYNRRYFNETVAKEVEKGQRYRTAIAFLIIDIDGFKEVNDRYSHLTGDRVLQQLAALLEENVRSSDTVVRYGGDEFLVMMPETEDEIEDAITRLKSELARWNEESSPLDFPLTLATGTAHWQPGRGRDIEDVLKAADRRMYREKRSEDGSRRQSM
jgi:diguanylate cyclase (GGDEF)-like protein